MEDTGYPDGLMAETAVAALANLRDLDKPFFYALGFYKPHLPFNAPKTCVILKPIRSDLRWDLVRKPTRYAPPCDGRTCSAAPCDADLAPRSGDT